MNEYEVAYDPAHDLLSVRLSSRAYDSEGEQVSTEGGLDLCVDSSRHRLLTVLVPQFSRQVDFSELYDMFGPDFVKTLSVIQSQLTSARAHVTSDRDPLYSSRVRRHLVTA